MKYVLLLLLTTITACSNDEEPQQLSSGLKIFVTSSFHVGDFLNDPFLTGSNAIENADIFCNQDANRPNNNAYKALLIDGIHRDAVSLTDWVLLPNTTYYRSFGDIQVGTTSSSSIFPIIFQNFINSVNDQSHAILTGDEWLGYVWSGITDLTDYSTDGTRNCSNWTTSSNNFQGIYAHTNATSALALSADASVYCGAKLQLYCVEQQ